MNSEFKRRRAAGRAADKPPTTVWRALGFSVWNVAFLLLGMGLMAWLRPGPPAPRDGGGDQAPKVASTNPEVAKAGQHGPWGELEFTTFSLEKPDGDLPDARAQFPAARWMFEGYTVEKLAALFQSLETSSETRRLLLDRSRWQVAAEGVALHPSRELLRGLRQPARQRLYPILGESRFNFSQFHPFRFRGGGFDEWFANSSLPHETLEIVRDLTYSNKFGALCLSDVVVLQEKLTPAEFQQVLRTLYSEPTMLVSLRVRPSSDIKALAAYWGRGGREKEILPLLKSLAHVPGGGSISVTHLLPGFARLRLYAFHSDTNNVVSDQDCLWSALNFLRKEPDPRLARGVSPYDILKTEFAECRELPLLGDVLMVMENGKDIHACVFVADDLVFTKNGANAHQPWVLMRLTDVVARYSTGQAMSLVVMRPKNL